MSPSFPPPPSSLLAFVLIFVQQLERKSSLIRRRSDRTRDSTFMRIQLFRERLSAKMCTRQSRKVIWDMINTLFLILSNSCQNFFYCFPLARANIRPWPLVPFFQISLKNSELKTTHNTFLDCRVHFFRQLFSK